MNILYNKLEDKEAPLGPIYTTLSMISPCRRTHRESTCLKEGNYQHPQQAFTVKHLRSALQAAVTRDSAQTHAIWAGCSFA